VYLSFRADQYKKRPITVTKKVIIVTGTIIFITWSLSERQIHKPQVNEWFVKIHN
jgi:hypothetical protein